MNYLLFFKYTLFVALGGALGAVARFWVAEFTHLFFERGFPIGTLIVNVVGSFLMGLFAIYLFHKLSFNEELRSFMLIGILGAFTTFSTFSLDTIELVINGNIGFAVMNVTLSVILCILAAGFGVWLGYRM